MLQLKREHLARAAARALAGQGTPPVILVDGIGLLDNATVTLMIDAIGPALLCGDRRRAVDLAAGALGPLPSPPEPAAVAVRELEARAFVTWFAGLAAEAAFGDLPDGVATDEDGGGRVVHLSLPGTAHSAALRPGDDDRDWRIDVRTSHALVSRTELHDVDASTATALARAALHVLGARPPADETACAECELPIPDNASSAVDPSHATSCSLHPSASATPEPAITGRHARTVPA